MTVQDRFEIFIVAPPGLEPLVADETRAIGYDGARAVAGGVTLVGGWPDVWRCNLELRGAVRVLARIASFRALHLAQLDKRARKVDWASVLRPDVPVKVETTCRKSRIYHAGAAAQRISRAAREELGAEVRDDAEVVLKARIDDDLCTISVDTSGPSLHKRGHKAAVGKAPMRENLAALFLRACGFDGSEPVLDPMCGSGTFVIEAAEIAAGLQPGRNRSFAFEQLVTNDAPRVAALRRRDGDMPALRFYGGDRDDGAVRMAQDNAERAGVGEITAFSRCAISDQTPPDGPPGLVIVNPPYGARIGNKGGLHALHKALGEVLKSRFKGWRVGLVTSEPGLAKSTGLPFLPPGPTVPHGGLKIRLYRTHPLP